MADPTCEAVLDAIIRAWSKGEESRDETGVYQWMRDAAAAVTAVFGDVAAARDLVHQWQADRAAFPDGAAPVLEEVAELLTGGNRD